MVHDRVYKCQYCYTNLRFLQIGPEFDSPSVGNDGASAIELPTEEEQLEAYEGLANLV